MVSEPVRCGDGGQALWLVSIPTLTYCMIMSFASWLEGQDPAYCTSFWVGFLHRVAGTRSAPYIITAVMYVIYIQIVDADKQTALTVSLLFQLMGKRDGVLFAGRPMVCLWRRLVDGINTGFNSFVTSNSLANNINNCWCVRHDPLSSLGTSLSLAWRRFRGY